MLNVNIGTTINQPAVENMNTHLITDMIESQFGMQTMCIAGMIFPAISQTLQCTHLLLPALFLTLKCTHKLLLLPTPTYRHQITLATVVKDSLLIQEAITLDQK